MLDDRKARILRILVEEHIRTGQPVGSGTIGSLGNLGVSSATIRTELVALETAGYVVQPYTSSGRVPTAQAYRYYVDGLMRPRETPRASVRVAEFFASVQTELGRLLKATSGLLSEVTSYPSVVTGPSPVKEVVRAVHLLPATSDAVLMVVIMVTGRVSQSILHLAESVDDLDIQEAQRQLRKGLCGHTFTEAVDPEAPAGGLTPGARTLLAKADEAMATFSSSQQEIYLGPASYLAAWGELSKAHEILRLLEREAALLEMLAHLPTGTEVRIGNELGIRSAEDISLVTTTYGEASSGAGSRIGVLGPMRMDYGRTVSVLEEIGGGLEESLGDPQEHGG